MKFTTWCSNERGRGGGGVKGFLNNVQKNCTFLTGRLPLKDRQSLNGHYWSARSTVQLTQQKSQPPPKAEIWEVIQASFDWTSSWEGWQLLMALMGWAPLTNEAKYSDKVFAAHTHSDLVSSCSECSVIAPPSRCQVTNLKLLNLNKYRMQSCYLESFS